VKSFAPQLRIPGPTPLPDAVRQAGARQMINHRGPEFAALLARCTEGLQRAMATRNEVLFVSASGTGGLEAAVVNALSPGDPVLAVSIGSFGERFAKIAATYGAEVTTLSAEPGRAADPADVVHALAGVGAEGRHPAAVLLTHNETSTGVTNPIRELAEAVRSEAPDALLIVDGISGVGAVPFETDAWGLDVVVTGSQKSWMVPPGLAMIAVSERAWGAAEQATMPRFYFDLRAHREYAARGQTPWTPAIGVFFALGVGLDLIEAEGLEAVYARHAVCGAATRAGVEALGLRLFAEREHASDTVTAVHMPEGLEWKAFDADLRARGLIAAGGQGALAGRIFRIGHLGEVTLADILAVMEILEESLEAFGLPIERGAGVAAASRAADERLAHVPAGAPSAGASPG
jgi:aspartate aminotransferase-like enzyme